MNINECRDLENLTFNTLDEENITLDDSFDPDNNIFNTHGFANTTDFTTETLKTMMEVNNDISFSVHHINVRTLKKTLKI